ncbi:MAG: hypothetical protein AAF492_01445 [Verrucomicrobiota bacterium]
MSALRPFFLLFGLGLPGVLMADEGWNDRVSPRMLLHLQSARIDDGSDHATEHDVRRERWGIDLRLGRHGFLSAVVNGAVENGRPYENISQAWIAFGPQGNQKADLKKQAVFFGKLKPRFTYEYSIPAPKLRTLERSNLANRLSPAKTTGLMAQRRGERFFFQLGAYSGEDVEEFGNLDPDHAMAVVKISTDIGEALSVGVDLLAVRGDVEVVDEIERGMSGFLEGAGPMDLTWWAELMAAEGRGDTADLFGLTLFLALPTGDRTEWVARYHHAASTGGRPSISPQRRYERLLSVSDSPRFGRRYHSAYLGVNRVLRREKPTLKLMAGVEYARLNRDVYSGWTFMAGLRMMY